MNANEDDHALYMRSLQASCDCLNTSRNRSLIHKSLLKLFRLIDEGYEKGFLKRDQMDDYLCQLVDKYGYILTESEMSVDSQLVQAKFVSELLGRCWLEGQSCEDLNELITCNAMNHAAPSQLSKPYSCPIRTSKQGTINQDSVDKNQNNHDKLEAIIMAEVAEGMSEPIQWEDIAGLCIVKRTIQEIVIWPMQRPDIFVGLRGPPKGLLLFGPPGTGKTLIGRCIACQSKSKFFSISASSLTSKWEGEGEKLVRTLFRLARQHSPSVIFMDEIDSLLTHRKEGENDAARRIKTEFLVQMDGIRAADSEERVLMIGATNRPQEIDDAARRRFTKRLYIPLPELEGRKQMLRNALKKLEPHILNDSDVEKIGEKTEGYSGADMACLCQEAAMSPIRHLAASSLNNISEIRPDQLQPVSINDFEEAFKRVKPSVGQGELCAYQKWNHEFGTMLTLQ